MIEVAAVVGVLAVLSAVVGLPAAFAVRERTDGWTALLVDAVLYGLALGSLGIVLWSWLGAAGIAIAVIGILVFVVMAVRRGAGLPSFTRPRRLEVVYGAAWLLLLLVAMGLRFHNANFIMWTGDMGAYVNWSNEFVRTGEFGASWPPLFPAFLSVATALFGAQATTAGLPLAGLLLIVALARTALRFGVERWIVFGVSVLVVFSVHATWYSSFPSSESLNAPLVLVWLGTIVGLFRSSGMRFAAYAALSFVSMLALGMLRSTGPALLIPVGIVLVFAFIVPQWRGFTRALSTTIIMGAAAGAIVYWYGIVEIPRYFVDSQIRSLVPGFVSKAMDSVGLFDATMITAALLIVGVVALGVAAYFAERHWPSSSPNAVTTTGGETGIDTAAAASDRIVRRFSYVVGALLGLGVILDGIVRAEVFAILVRIGLWLAIVSILAFFLPRLVRVPAERLIVMLILGLSAGMFIALHTIRLKIFRDHAFFIYWDRYLVSETYPALLMVLTLGVSTLWVWFSPRYREWRLSRVADSPARGRLVAAGPAVALVVLVLAVVVPAAPLLATVTSDTYMKGNYDFQQRVADLVPSTSDAVYWSSTTGEQLDDFFFPNTWMAFAVPLERSQGYTVLNASQSMDNFRPDDVADSETLIALAACEGISSVVVLETDAGGENLEARLAEHIDAGELTIRHLGREESSISLLAQPPTAGWTHANISVDGWLVDVSPDAAPAEPCDG